MTAVILAAGKGTRMRELTSDIPKPMLPVRGKPVLEHIVEGIKAAGIRDIRIVTGWHAEAIENYFGDGAKFGVSLSYVRQETQNGTAKAAALAKSFVGDDAFLLAYGDILVDPETYARLAERFSGGAFSGVVAVRKGEDVRKGGLFFFDEEFILTRLVEKPGDEEIERLKKEGWIREGEPLWYNAAVGVFSPAIFEFIEKLKPSPRGEYELTDALKECVKKGRRIAGLPVEGLWADVRDPEILAALQK